MEWALRGYGPIQANRAMDGKGSPAEIRATIAALHNEADPLWPEYLVWSQTLKARAAKEGFVDNIYGRRAWGLRERDAQRFVVESAIHDMVWQIATQLDNKLGAKVLAVGNDSLALSHPRAYTEFHIDLPVALDWELGGSHEDQG